MKKNNLLGESVLPISNFILQEHFVQAPKPEYEHFENGFYFAAENMEEFLREHVDKELITMYHISKEYIKIIEMFEKLDITETVDEEKYVSSKKYRQYLKNKIFDTKVDNLLNLEIE